MYLSVAAFNERARRSYDRCGFTEFSSHWQTFKSDAGCWTISATPRSGTCFGAARGRRDADARHGGAVTAAALARSGHSGVGP